MGGPRLLASCSLLLVALSGGCGDDDGVRPGVDAGRVDAGRWVHDELSRPEEPTLSIDSFNQAADCNLCHETHYAQWKTSMHAYAMVDPVYQALVALRQADYDGAQDQFCLQCHSAIGTRGGEIVDNFAFDELSPITMEGVTCEACHKVVEMQRDHNSGHVLDPDGPIRGPFADPMDGPGHESVQSSVLTTSEFCAGCHDVVELSGLHLERPYGEWLESPANESNRTCQDCHMPTYRGRATEDAPERDLHEHYFVGVDVPLSEGFATAEEVTEIRGRVQALLESSASLRLEAADRVRAGQQLDLVVTVRNDIEGHNLPTGSTFIRELWLEVVVTDGAGDRVYETGTLDTNGDLRGHFSAVDPYGDDDLITFGSRLIGPTGEPELLPWRSVEHASTSIPPLHERTHTLFVPTSADTPGPLSVTARLRFRTHPPHLLRLLSLEGLVEKLEIYDIAASTTSVDIDPT